MKNKYSGYSRKEKLAVIADIRERKGHLLGQGIIANGTIQYVPVEPNPLQNSVLVQGKYVVGETTHSIRYQPAYYEHRQPPESSIRTLPPNISEFAVKSAIIGGRHE